MYTFFYWLKLLTLILLFSVIVYPQKESFMTSRVEGDISFDYLQELVGSVFLRKSNQPELKNMQVAIRLCSDEALETAITKSALRFPTILDTFEQIGFSRSEVFLLRFPNCKSKKKWMVASEIWVIPENSKFPPYTEKVSSDKLKITVINETEYRFSGDANYKDNASKLSKLLKEDEKSVGIIVSLYEKSPDRARKMLEQVSNSLRKDKLNSSRFKVILSKRSRGSSINYLNASRKPKNVFPSFFVIAFL